MCNCGGHKKKKINTTQEEVLLGELPGNQLKVSKVGDGKYKWQSATLVKLNKN